MKYLFKANGEEIGTLEIDYSNRERKAIFKLKRRYSHKDTTVFGKVVLKLKTRRIQ